MVTEKKAKGQIRPPTGIKFKDWARKKHLGHAPSHAYGRTFGSQTCANGHETHVGYGSRPLTECPACKVPMDHKGYLQPKAGSSR